MAIVSVFRYNNRCMHTQIQMDPSVSCPLGSGLSVLLLQSGLVTDDVLQSLRIRSDGNEMLLEKLLMNEGYLTETQLCELKAKMHGWHFAHLDLYAAEQEDVKELSESFLSHQYAIPFRRKGVLQIATIDPGNRKVLRLLAKKFGPETEVFLASKTAIIDALAHLDTGFSEKANAVIRKHELILQAKGNDNQSIIELLDALLLHGVRSHASDIHVEPRKHEAIVRERVDGMLHRILTFEKDVHALLCLRVKVLANLATDEHARPQDGKLQFEDPEGKQVDVRVSVIPTTDGEKIVMRLLAPEDRALTIEALGMQRRGQEQLDAQMRRSWGMILVTGPTGSGKTTSLYAVLRRLHKESVNIATIEDPVEYDLPGVSQIQVNEQVNLTFATGLKSIVRQDPNIILVGEIRDADTANIAVNAAMTGHLVLSTLHTNDAATALPRLSDMGIQPFLISSTINVIVAQRLVRKICMNCRESLEIPVADLKASVPAEVLAKLSDGKKTIHTYHGKGCDNCHKSGFQGRTGIFELLDVTDGIRALIMQNVDAETIRKAAVKEGMITMFDDGMEKVLQGITTLEEVMRVIRF